MLGVILIHFNNAWPSPIRLFALLAKAGPRMPQLFFIISGYLTWQGLERAASVNWKMFFATRLTRIAPIFYTAIVVATIIPVVRMQNVSLGEWASHITFLNGLFPSWINSIMGIEWYIADLALFYMLCPILYRVAHDLRGSIRIFIVFAVLSFAALFIYRVLGGGEDDSYDIQTYFQTFFVLHQLPVAMLGVVLYYMVHGLGSRQLRLAIVGSVAAATLFTVMLLFPPVSYYIPRSLVAGFVLAPICLACCELHSVFEAGVWDALVYTGAHSFGVYCFHQTVINCMLRVVPRDAAISWLATLSAIVLVSIAVGSFAESVQGRFSRTSKSVRTL